MKRFAITSEQLTRTLTPPQIARPSQVQLDNAQGVFVRGRVGLDWRVGSALEVLAVAARMAASPCPRALPEVLLLGATNLGKSTLVNNVFAGRRAAGAAAVAKTSAKANCTFGLDFYTVGNVLRVVDLPGYGRVARREMGEMVMAYLDARGGRECKRVYVVVDMGAGVAEPDVQVLEMLRDSGVSHDVVFTKADVVVAACRGDWARVGPALGQAYDAVAAVLAPARVYVTNTGGNGMARGGYEGVRWGIVEAVGLDGVAATGIPFARGLRDVDPKAWKRRWR